MKYNHWFTKFSLICTLVVWVPACHQDSAPIQGASPEKVSLQLKWQHEAQFAGFYMAIEKGIYRDHGLEVTLLEGGNKINQSEQLVSGEADFAILPAESVLMRRDTHPDIVAIAAIYQYSPLVFASHETSGIHKPEDFLGKRVAIGGMESGGFAEAPAQFYAMMKKLGLEISDVEIVDYDPTLASFISGKVDVTPISLLGSAANQQLKGYEINTLWPGDYGIDFYSDVLAVTPGLIRERPDVIQRFVNATIKGWQASIGNTEEAVKITMKYAAIQDSSLQAELMEVQIPLIHSGHTHIGTMKAKTWQGMHDILLEHGIITDHCKDINLVLNTDFLNHVHESEIP